MKLFGGVALVAALATQIAPVNDRPNPYQTIQRWGTLPAGREWGSTSGVDVDRDGQSVWVAERCGGGSCLDSPLAPVLKFNASGTLVTSFFQGEQHTLQVNLADLTNTLLLLLLAGAFFTGVRASSNPITQ